MKQNRLSQLVTFLLRTVSDLLLFFQLRFDFIIVWPSLFVASPVLRNLNSTFITDLERIGQLIYMKKTL